jgi:hypothetical protein
VGRHGSRAALVAALCALTAALLAGPALAAPELGDAGELPLTAQEPGPAGPLRSITGNVGTFDSDMYKVCLTGGADFSASTVGTTGFDTQLFLFDERGMGVYANDDDLGGAIMQSRLPAGHALGPKTPGVYYLAISAFDRDPQSSPDPRLGYIFLPSLGVVGPIDRGGGAPITGWAHRLGDKPGGAYAISLTGTRSCVDDTPPTVTLTTPPDGAAYAQDEVVLADYECADESDGSGLASCAGDVPDGQAIDTATLGTHEFTVTARDRRGNETTVTHTYTVEDGTAPEVNLLTPRDGAFYPRGEPVSADYECTDEAGGSGIVSCAGDVPDGEEIDTSTVGEHSFTVTATDGAGNTTVVTHTYTVFDRVPPTVTVTTPPEGAVYGQGEVVIADYACTDEDGGSGLASCAGDVPDGQAINTATLGPHTFTVVALDSAGNRAEVSHSYTVEDRAAPAIALRTPAAGATYALGAVVAADYACADAPGGSGVASCTGDVPDGAPIDTAAVGDHTFTVRAVDAAGNDATRSVSYRVEERFAFDFEGFFSPVRNRPRVNLARAGSLVPMRFSLDGWQGRDVIADGYPRSREMECGSTADLDGGEPARAVGRWRLRYRPRRDLYVYLWKTDRDWVGECRQFILRLADGSYHRADFRFLRKRRHWHDIWNG